MYDELIAPFDEKILKAFGGGIHCCGDVDSIVQHFIALRYAQCFDFGQSELNDVESAYETASKRKLGLTRIAASEQELLDGQILRKYPTGAESFEHAQNIITEYKTIST